MTKTKTRGIVKTKKNKVPVTAMVSKSSTRSAMPRFRMAGAHAAKGDKQHADVKAWLKQLNRVFDRNVRPVSMPLFKDLYPCPTTIVANLGSANVLMANTNLVCQFWPNGSTIGNSTLQSGVSGTTIGGITSRIGPNLNSATLPTSVGCIYQTTSALAEAALVAPALATTNALLYDGLINPFPSGNTGTSGANGMQFRTAAFGVRFSFVGKLADTEGYVEWYAPYELPNANPGVVIRSLRKDPSYRRCYFSDQRTFEFFWEPTCDDIEFSQDNGDNATVTSVNSRHFAILGGLASGDKLEIEYVTFQDWTGVRALSTSVPVYVAANPSALANTVLATHGSINSDVSDGKTHQAVDKWEVYSHLVGAANSAVDLYAKFANHPASQKLARLLKGAGRAASVF